MASYKLVPVELIRRAVYVLERFANDTLDGRNSAHELRELLSDKPDVQVEPVGRHTEDYLDDKSATTYSAEVAQRWREKGWPVSPLYADPQPAPNSGALLEAIAELCDEIDKHEIHATISETNILWFKRKARNALNAYYR